MEISHSEAGDPEAEEAVVFLHGIGGDRNSFQPQLDALSDRYRLLAWDMPGYGQSSALPEISFESLAQAWLNWLDSLELKHVHLVGQSIGGMLALECLHRYPQRVKSLTLIATTAAFGGRDDRFRDQFLRARLAPLDAGKSMRELALEFVPEITAKGVSACALQAAIRSMQGVSEDTYRSIIACLVTFNRRDMIDRLKLPVCLIAGAHDNNAPAKTMRRMHEKMPLSTFHCVEGAGHLVNLEKPGVVNAIIRSFLDSHSDSSPTIR